MAVFTVTSTSDNANDPGSLRAVLLAAQNSPGAVIQFSLPAGSVITITNGALATPTVAVSWDFSGAPGLTIGGAANVIRDAVAVQISGALNVNSTGASALLMNNVAATAVLHGSANLTDASGGNPTILITGGSSLSLEAGARVASSTNGAIVASSGGAGLARLDIAAGAIVSGTSGTSATIYYDPTVPAGVINNAGTITATGNNGVFISPGSTLTNTGSISTTAAGFPTVYFSGAATITSSGVISAPNSANYAIGGNAASGLVTINLQTGSSTTGNVGGNLGATFAFSLAGSLTGAIFGGTANDTATLYTTANLSQLTAINLGGGQDTLVLAGAGAASLNDALVGNVEALVKTDAGSWTLTGGTAFTSVALNGGLLELANAGAAGTGAITFGAGAQTLQLDGRAAGGVFEDTLATLGLGDQVDVRGIGQAFAASVSGNSIQLKNAAGAVIYTLNVDSGAALSAYQLVVGSDGAGGTVVSLASPAPPVGTGTAPPSPSTQLGFTTQFDNLIRASANDPALANPSTPIGAQAQAEAALAARLDAGQIGAADAQLALYHLADGTTSVAEISYAFFTGRTPTAAGLNYLVHSTANPTDLNDAYYARFTTENRYINFAVNLATGAGAGAAAFQSAYGSLSLTDATAKAYQAVFGVAASADKVSAILNTLVSNGLGGTETRAQYFADISGGTATAQKAAVIGFLLADSVKEGFGVYQQANLHFLQDLAHGTAVYGVDLLGVYGPAPTLVGAPVADPTLPG